MKQINITVRSCVYCLYGKVGSTIGMRKCGQLSREVPIAGIPSDCPLPDYNPTPMTEGVDQSQSTFLINAVYQGVNYSIQYTDYDENTWTASSELTHKRLAQLMDDHSVKRIRLEFNKQ